MAHIKPIDKEDLISNLKQYLTERANIPQVLRIGIKDEYTAFVGTQNYIRKAYGLDGISIANTIIERYKKA